MHRKTSLLEWWWLISENKCDSCANSLEDHYNEALKAVFTIKRNVKNPRHPKT
jgi:hypothetical protein